MRLIHSGATEKKRYQALNGMVKELGYLNQRIVDLKVAKSDRGGGQWGGSGPLAAYG